jgi:hypothetical protein
VVDLLPAGASADTDGNLGEVDGDAGHERVPERDPGRDWERDAVRERDANRDPVTRS